MIARRPLEERFWQKVYKRGARDCWPWRAGRQTAGYGKINAGGKHGRTILAHRASWELVNGRVPRGLHVLHRCDVPACVNPAHLFLGTSADNTHDMLVKGRQKNGWRARNRDAFGRFK